MPLAAALAAVGPAAYSQTPEEPGIELRVAPSLQPPPRGDAANKLPIVIQARELRGRPDLDTVAEGDAEFRRGGIVIKADRMSYDHPEDLAVAHGNVRISRDGNIYSGPELQLRVQRFEGFFLNPTYFFSRTGAGGTAQRVDFIDDQRAVLTGATYTSCPPDGSGGPAWLLTTDRVKLDFETNEGTAEGAVLRFLGVPILAAPKLTFPLTDDRKSGWLPPSITLDNKNGLQTSVPYYWNIAPNHDATFTPGLSTKRGPSLGTEFRYLEPSYNGLARLNLMPNDRQTGHARYALNFAHDGLLANGTQLTARVLRVSDDDYWKDFPRDLPTIMPRLLATDLQARRPFSDWNVYTRVLRWQVIGSADSPIDPAPYERLPQIGARTVKRFGQGFEASFEAEFNRFSNPVGTINPNRQTGSRVHTLASISRPYITPGWSLTPKLSLNAATYSVELPINGRRQMSRAIPTFSLDSAWVLERDTTFFGRALRQTLEPRLFYVNTPFHDQSGMPDFDTPLDPTDPQGLRRLGGKDFNFESIYSENAFAGIDRVSDAHQVTAGVTTRLIDPATGAEAVRLGIMQRYLFREQRVTPDGVPFNGRFSDVLLLGSSSIVPRWRLDGSLQYSPETRRIARSIVGMRYSPGPFRTVNMNYRLARGSSEQLELGWQWPIYGPTPLEQRQRSASECKGTWYGVGRINYSMRDSRIADSIFGMEYDAGCWIGRIVAERLSTGRSEATTRLLFQLELVGLSRLGSNPLQVLKDNIPGYRLLRDAPVGPPTTMFYD